MSDVEVREATVEDIPDILRIGEASWNRAYSDILDDSTIAAAMAEWYTPESTEEFVEHDDVGYYVAEAGTEVRGYVTGGPSGDDGVAYLGALYVHPDQWGEGTGTALVERFEAFCRDEEYDQIELRVLAENDIGLSFYRQSGYEVVEREQTELFGQRVSECVCRKAIQVSADSESESDDR